jgi:hypothetical protein
VLFYSVADLLFLCGIPIAPVHCLLIMRRESRALRIFPSLIACARRIPYNARSAARLVHDTKQMLNELKGVCIALKVEREKERVKILFF